jgi:hypothetical protein
MGLPARKRGQYTLKTYQAELYTWSPDTTVNKANVGRNVTQNFCNATPFSQGEDWIVTYVYETEVEGAHQKRLAYVACDYVK